MLLSIAFVSFFVHNFYKLMLEERHYSLMNYIVGPKSYGHKKTQLHGLPCN